MPIFGCGDTPAYKDNPQYFSNLDEFDKWAKLPSTQSTGVVPYLQRSTISADGVGGRLLVRCVFRALHTTNSNRVDHLLCVGWS